MSSLYTMSSTSAGSSTLVIVSGMSIVLAPLVFGKYSLEKFSSASISSIIPASSPSVSLLSAEWKIGCAKNACVLLNPIILPIIPADVCGASAIISCPISSDLFFRL